MLGCVSFVISILSVSLLGSNVCFGIPMRDVSCYYDDGVGYHGNADKTETGKPCMNWSVAVKESKGSSAGNFPDTTLEDAKNYCRNPDGDTKPWCYTTDATARWEYCDVPQCKKVLGDSCTEDDQCSNVAHSVCGNTSSVCTCAMGYVSTPASKTTCYQESSVLGASCFFNEQCKGAHSSCTGIIGPTCQCDAGYIRDVSPVSAKQPKGDPDTCYKKTFLQDTCEFSVQCSSQVKNSVCDLSSHTCVCDTNYVSIAASNRTCYLGTTTLGGPCYFSNQCIVANSHCGYPGSTCVCNSGYEDSGSNTCTQEASCKSTMTGCGVYRGCAGVIESANFPNAYPHETDCTYRIEGNPGQVVILKSTQFKTEENYDILTITYGSTTKEYSGETSFDINTGENIVTLQFTSDEAKQYSGFSINYTIE